MPETGRVRILGVDPGLLRLGYGVIDRLARARLSYVECGVITGPASASRSERLATIGQGLRELVAEVRPDEVALELAFYGKNVQSTLALGEARGVVSFVVSEAGLKVAGYAPAAVKRAIVGHGAATKEQVGYLVRSLLCLRRVPEPDAADALAIAICHARQHSFPGARAGARSGPRLPGGPRAGARSGPPRVPNVR